MFISLSLKLPGIVGRAAPDPLAVDQICTILLTLVQPEHGK
jgi:hypothetical protein